MENCQKGSYLVEAIDCFVEDEVEETKGEVILLVPPVFCDTLGGTGAIITIPLLDKIHQGQD